MEVQEPKTPSSLRWTPSKRPVTVERNTVRARALGSPVKMAAGKENVHGLRLKALAPPPPLLPLAPVKKMHSVSKAQVADRLRQRLQFAYYKLRTHQEHRPLAEVTASSPLCI